MTSLGSRMNELIKKYNSNEFHPYRYHVIRLNSKEILKFVNCKSSSIYEHISKIENYNNILNKVVSKLYNKFSPYLIYAFNNEINFVFFDSEINNIHKKISDICSYTSSAMTLGLIPEEPIMYSAKIIEFNIDYEALNYLRWRQNDCKRNNLFILYKYITDNVNNRNIEEIYEELTLLGLVIPEYILNGTVFKKGSIIGGRNLVHMTYKNFNNMDFDKLMETLLSEKYFVSMEVSVPVVAAL